MKPKSDPTQLLRTVRLRNSISDLKAAYRMGIHLDKYIVLEANPKMASSQELEALFRAIECTPEDVAVFQEILLNGAAHHHLDRSKDQKLFS